MLQGWWWWIYLDGVLLGAFGIDLQNNAPCFLWLSLKGGFKIFNQRQKINKSEILRFLSTER